MKYHKYWKHAQILRRCIKSATTQPPFLTKYKYKKKCEFKVYTMMIRIPAKCPEGIFCPLHPLPIKARRPKFRFTFISQRDWIQILFSAHSYLDYLAENMKGNKNKQNKRKLPESNQMSFWSIGSHLLCFSMPSCRMTRFQLILPVRNHDVTKNLAGHLMHVEGPQICQMNRQINSFQNMCDKYSEPSGHPQISPKVYHTYSKIEEIAMKRPVFWAIYGDFWGREPRLYRETGFSRLNCALQDDEAV